MTDSNILIWKKKQQAQELFQRNDLPGAKNLYREMVQLDPRNLEAWEMLGAINGMLGMFSEATECCRRTIALRPDSFSAYANLGAALGSMADMPGALEAYRKVSELKPDFVDAHFNMGYALFHLGEPVKALASVETALRLAPNLASAHHLRGHCLRQLGRFDEAFTSFKTALDLEPNSETFRNGFIEGLQHIEFLSLDASIMRHIEASIESPKADYRLISSAIVSVLKLDSSIRQLIDLSNRNDYSAIKQGVLQRVFSATFRNKVLFILLRKAVIHDRVFESMLTILRRICLEILTDGDPVYPTWMLSEESDFATALAQQCFNNEYAYFVEDDEMEQVEGLRRSVSALMRQGLESTTTLQRKLTVLAMYQPLSTIEGSHHLMAWRSATLPNGMLDLIETQVGCNLIEQDNIGRIASLTDVENPVSLKVSQQYEESPYPRWIATVLPSPLPFDAAITRITADSPALRWGQNRITNPRILIAGCGTGQHAVQTASHFAGSEVLAIDLSRASLAYAMRKAEELHIGNIRFRQADILGLGALQERFNLIEAVGVLHHMENPMEGLRILTGLLEPHGFMRIGLYSRKARTYIEKARELIRSRGLPDAAAGIRSARKMFFDLAKDGSPNDVISKVVKSSDFYSLSNCRDLLFHVQETCYDLGEIASMLDRAGLRFLGFELNPRTMQQFRERYPSSDDLADLQKWDAFENRYPDSFTAMYQFWCQRADFRAVQ